MISTKNLPKANALGSMLLLGLFFALASSSSFAASAADSSATVGIAKTTVKIPVKIDTSENDLIIGEEEMEKFESAIPRFDNSEYRRRLELLSEYTTVPLTYNQYVQAYIDVYSLRRREQVSKMLALKEYYFPTFEKILAAKGMPEELKYLSIVESAMNPFAVSRVGATGLWQFMYTTGKMYKLNIDNYEDERKDPEKATAAAAQYFQDMYERYHDWLLVIAAYNCGPGSVSRAIRRAGGVYNFWAIRKYLPQETRGYVPAFIAATYIMNYSNVHNIYPEYPDFSFETDTVKLTSMVSFERLSTALGMSMDELRMLNPIYKKGLILASVSTPKKVRIPKHKVEIFATIKDSLQRYQPPVTLVTYTESPEVTTHKVKRGEYIAKIAAMYNVSVSDIRRWNGLTSNRLYTGTYLKVYKTKAKNVTYYAEVEDPGLSPKAVEPAPTVVATQGKPNSPAPTTLPGSRNVTEQLSDKDFDAPAKEQVILVSKGGSPNAQYASTAKTSTTTVTAHTYRKPTTKKKSTYTSYRKPVRSALASNGKKAPIRYTVRRGDTLFTIAKRYGTTVDQIRRMNKISNPRNIKAGTVIRVMSSKG